MERAALRGAAETIARCRPIIYLENDKPEQETGLIDDLLALDYRIFWHAPAMYEANNFRGDDENIYEENGAQVVSFNMLCIPPGDERDMAGFVAARAGEGREAMQERVMAETDA
jgi:hypothetical protein